MSKLARWQKKYKRRSRSGKTKLGELVPAKQELRQFNVSTNKIYYKYALRSNPLLTRTAHKHPVKRNYTLDDWTYRLPETTRYRLLAERLNHNTLTAVGAPIRMTTLMVDTADLQALRMVSISDRIEK